jgi:hypothetical protein
MRNLLTLLILLTSLSLVGQDYNDCNDAFPICGDTVFTFDNMTTSSGEDDYPLDNLCVDIEAAPIWVEWTMEEAGALTFVLTPTNETDDLDFIVFQVTGELCQEMTPIRCMASGESIGSPSESCMGPTGLAEGETDATEFPGCNGGSNNFLAPIQTNVGDRYVMLVNNFSVSGLDFQLEFDGAKIADCGSTSTQDQRTDRQFFTVTQQNSELIINFDENSSQSAQLEIYNLLGQLIQNDFILDNNKTIDVANIQTGPYLIRAKRGNEIETKKIFVAQ